MADPKLAVLAGWPLFGGAEAPLAETCIELSTEQERNHPAAKQKHEFDGFGGHRRESPYQRGCGRNIAQRRVFPKIRLAIVYRPETDRYHTYSATMTTTDGISTGERAELLETLAKRRYFLRFTVRGLTDAQAAQRTTASALCLGGLIKHVAATEQGWLNFVVGGAEGMAAGADADWTAGFKMLEGETLAGLLEAYDLVARKTDEIVRALPDLDASHPLPEAPWFEPGVSWSARQVLLHLIGETAQHAGHADIIRESMDGAKSMG
jgi:Protein of unknown function (DUF664)